MSLKTKRLTLRAPEYDDVDGLHRIFSDPDAMRYWSTAPHPDKATTKAMLDRWVPRAHDAAETYGQPLYLIFEKDGDIIGCGGLAGGDEVGFMLRPDHWGQGYGTEAMETIIPTIFAATDLMQLTADADPQNDASCALLRKLGFHETHRAKNTFCINGVWSDSVYFALLRASHHS